MLLYLLVQKRRHSWFISTVHVFSLHIKKESAKEVSNNSLYRGFSFIDCFSKILINLLQNSYRTNLVTG